MYDTIAAMIEVHDLDVSKFQGGAVMEDFGSGRSSARAWHNGDGDGYHPRITYWPDGRLLKVEASLPKLCGRTVINPLDVESAIERLDALLGALFGDLPSVDTWTVQRVDYAWQWEVSPHAAAYLSVWQNVQVTGLSRQDYGADGVVWKQGNRWIKVYDKSRESGGLGGTLRFEVSNYKSAVKYMCKRWFGCDRVVSEVLQPGRALYVLAREGERIGLFSDISTEDGVTLARLRDCYGRRAASAFYVLTLLQTYGDSAHKAGLISRSSLSEWRARLRRDGFVNVVGDGYEVRGTGLKPLHLNLDVAGVRAYCETWGEMSAHLGVVGPESAYLMQRAVVQYA